MCNWVIRANNDWLQLIFDRMYEILLSKDVIHCDETACQVLHEPGRNATSKSYVCVTTTSRHGESAMEVIPVACTIHILREFKNCLRGMDKDDCSKSSAQKAVNML